MADPVRRALLTVGGYKPFVSRFWATYRGAMRCRDGESSSSTHGFPLMVLKEAHGFSRVEVHTVKAAAKKAADDAAKKKADDAKKQSESSQPALDSNGHDTRSIGTIVDEVINGKYANGDERKKLLGDRYDEVQKQVNQKCLVDKDPRCVINSM